MVKHCINDIIIICIFTCLVKKKSHTTLSEYWLNEVHMDFMPSLPARFFFIYLMMNVILEFKKKLELNKKPHRK